MMPSDNTSTSLAARPPSPTVRAVMTIAASQREAEQKVLAGASHLRVLRPRRINLDGIAVMLSKPLDQHWAVVVAQLTTKTRPTRRQTPRLRRVSERDARPNPIEGSRDREGN